MFTSRQLAFCNGFSCYNNFFSLKYYIKLVECIETCWIYNVDIVFVKSHVFIDKKNQEFCNESFRVKTDDSVCCIHVSVVYTLHILKILVYHIHLWIICTYNALNLPYYWTNFAPNVLTILSSTG